MAKIKLTKSAVDAAQPQAKPIELRDTVEPGFLCKITLVGRKVFMLQYPTNAGERRKPALGQYGELTVDQVCTMAQEWLAEVRKGGDSSMAKNAARKAPTMKEYYPYVLSSPNDPTLHLTHSEHYGDLKRVLNAASVPHVGTHGIRYRATTDIANSGG